MPVIFRLQSIRLLIVVCLSGTTAVAADLPSPYLPTYPISPAEILYQITKFIQWPTLPADGPFRVAIIGRDPLEAQLRAEIDGRPVGGLPILIRKPNSATELERCRIVFIGASEQSRLRAILDTVRAPGTLTVSSIDGFASAGGMITILPGPGRPRFVINPSQIRKAGLIASSRLLRLSANVRSAWDTE